jgi:hypothetical protein
VTAAGQIPGGYHDYVRVEIDGPTAPAPSSSGHRVQPVGVDPDFFEALLVPIVAGRGFDASDIESGESVVVVNEDFVRVVLGAGVPSDVGGTTGPREKRKRRVMRAVGGMAVLLATSGIYAILSFSVSRRTREIGVRVALGAGRVQVASAVASRPPIFDCRKRPRESNAFPEAPTRPSAHAATSPSGVTR